VLAVTPATMKVLPLSTPSYYTEMTIQSPVGVAMGGGGDDSGVGLGYGSDCFARFKTGAPLLKTDIA